MSEGLNVEMNLMGRKIKVQAEVCPCATNRSVEFIRTRKSEMICGGYNFLAAANHGALNK